MRVRTSLKSNRWCTLSSLCTRRCPALRSLFKRRTWVPIVLYYFQFLAHSVLRHSQSARGIVMHEAERGVYKHEDDIENVADGQLLVIMHPEMSSTRPLLKQRTWLSLILCLVMFYATVICHAFSVGCTFFDDLSSHPTYTLFLDSGGSMCGRSAVGLGFMRHRFFIT